MAYEHMKHLKTLIIQEMFRLTCLILIQAIIFAPKLIDASGLKGMNDVNINLA